MHGLGCIKPTVVDTCSTVDAISTCSQGGALFAGWHTVWLTQAKAEPPYSYCCSLQWL